MTEVCDLFGALCFSERMDRLDRLADSGCLPDCRGVTFTYSESSTLLE